MIKMQMLQAVEEQSLKPVCNPSSIDIVKLSNPNCYVPFDTVSRLGKHSRVKKTVPKVPRDLVVDEENGSLSNDSDMEPLPLFQTPPDTPPSEKRLKKTKIRTSSFQSLENGLPFCEESDLYYRRFSSRKRKQTTFLGVTVSSDHIIQEKGNRRGRFRRNSTSRRLVFPVELEEKQVEVSDICESQREDGDPPVAKEEAETERSLSTEDISQNGKETPQENAKPITREMLEVEFPIGTMVWGKLPGYCWWPGTVISYNNVEGVKEEQDEEGEAAARAWIKWFGETQLSKIAAEKLAHFYEFKEFFQPLQFKGTYKKAIFASIKEAAKRCKVTFLSSPEDKKLRWMFSEDSLLPKLISENSEDKEQESTPSCEEADKVQAPEKSAEQEATGGMVSSSSTVKGKSHGGRGKRGRGKGDKAGIRLTSLEQEMLEWACNGFLPGGIEGLLPTAEENEAHVQVIPIEAGNSEEKGHDDSASRKKQKVMLLQVRSKARFDSVLEGRAKLSEMCIGCGDFNIVADHPLFIGGLCLDCKNYFMETAYLFDEDGSQMYCTICSAGEEVFMCDAENCSKVYCGPCVEKLCGSAELNRVRVSEKWLCYMCSPEHSHVGLLEKRENWDSKLRELFLDDHEMDYDSPTFYRAIPPEERRPIKVLGLFDGIATGLVVLKELGLEVEQYVASEVDTDAVYVTMVQHKEIIHVGNIERITEKEIRAWGPFDLIMGGSPCNDLSVVNPARRGIYEGTGRLFFEFFRILSYARPAPGEDRPFFWLFENVVSMKPQDKQTISRFLQCNPVVVDAKDISAAHRARYFWGNLPGMNRPTTALPLDRLTLQSCLEPNCFRVAQFTKLRTITTKMNSIKQTKKAIFPVRFEGQDKEEQGDVLWCTEMERLFGFPEHYTDVANLGRAGRQRLLGKAWSVPVIRHLLSPLKDYFKSSTTREGGCGAVGSTGDATQVLIPIQPPIPVATTPDAVETSND